MRCGAESGFTLCMHMNERSLHNNMYTWWRWRWFQYGFDLQTTEGFVYIDTKIKSVFFKLRQPK